jgi:probable sporulation protein (polysaccharide deacetylase family)
MVVLPALVLLALVGSWGLGSNQNNGNSLQRIPSSSPTSDFRLPTSVSGQPIYEGTDTSNLVALVVNVDWGEEFLPEMLEVCRQHDVRLTFFVTGRWAGKFPELLRQMAEDGHEIGNHGFGHPHPDQLSVELNRQDIQRAEAVIQEIISRRTALFAPPYGERGPAVLEAAESAGYRTVLWSVDTLDWKLRNTDAITARVINRVHPGAIVLMHPLAATAEALPVIIKELKQNDYAMVTVSRLLAE